VLIYVRIAPPKLIELHFKNEHPTTDLFGEFRSVVKNTPLKTIKTPVLKNNKPPSMEEEQFSNTQFFIIREGLCNKKTPPLVSEKQLLNTQSVSSTSQLSSFFFKKIFPIIFSNT
jgi:hypothetical protein